MFLHPVFHVSGQFLLMSELYYFLRGKCKKRGRKNGNMNKKWDSEQFRSVDCYCCSDNAPRLAVQSDERERDFICWRL